MAKRRGAPEKLHAFSLDPERVRELIADTLELFGEPLQLPRRPKDALEPRVYAANLRAGKRDEDGMHATAIWLRRLEEVQQWNRSALGTVLWAARQCCDVVPEAVSVEFGHRIRLALRNWGLPNDVPPDLPACHRLTGRYGTDEWPAASNPRRAART